MQCRTAKLPRKKFLHLHLCLSLIMFSACSVRPEDQEAWVGASAAKLDDHPMFSKMNMVRATAPDGIEIRNYVNAESAYPCSAGGDIYGRVIDYETYRAFMKCMQKFNGCNNTFQIKDGVVKKYDPISSGVSRCFTDDRARPDYRG